MDPQAKLTDVQREAFKLNESEFAALEEHKKSVREAAEARLRDADYEPGDLLYCYICTCSSFLPPENGEVCEREFCRHTAMQHA